MLGSKLMDQRPMVQIRSGVLWIRGQRRTAQTQIYGPEQKQPRVDHDRPLMDQGSRFNIQKRYPIARSCPFATKSTAEEHPHLDLILAIRREINGSDIFFPRNHGWRRHGRTAWITGMTHKTSIRSMLHDAPCKTNRMDGCLPHNSLRTDTTTVSGGADVNRGLRWRIPEVAEANTTRDTVADLPSILVKVTCTTPGVDDGPIVSSPTTAMLLPYPPLRSQPGFDVGSRVSRSLTFIHHGQVRARGGIRLANLSARITRGILLVVTAENTVWQGGPTSYHPKGGRHHSSGEYGPPVSEKRERTRRARWVEMGWADWEVVGPR
jgi:hypothetical protein